MNKFLISILFFLLIMNYSSAQFQGLAKLWHEPEGERHRISSYNKEGLNLDYFVIERDQYQVLCNVQNTSGIIQRIWFTIDSNDSLYLQNIAIKMTFDNEITVNNLPIGMFTGTGPWRVNDINTPMSNIMRSRKGNKDQTGTGAGSFNIYWEMPFTDNVKIEILNGTNNKIKLFYYIDFVNKKLEVEPMLFHANYNIESPTTPSSRLKNLDVKKNYSFLKIDDYKGKYIGTIMCVESNPDRQGKWYEGDDMFVIDNEPWPPRLHGTGTEDYFGMAWGYHKRYQAFDHGVSHFEKNITDHDRFYDGRYVTYRFHLVDPILFYKSIDASIETGQINECRQHYESVAIWYGKKNGK